MITPHLYEKVRKAEAQAKKAGFNLDVRSNSFLISPTKAMAAALSQTFSKSFQSLEEVMSFIEGWGALEQLLVKKAGFSVTEVKERVEQQRVMDILKGKRGGARKVE